MTNPIRNRTPKSTSQRRTGKNKRHPNTSLISFIPKRQVINQPRKESRLRSPQQKPHSRHAGEILDPAQAHGDSPPAEHQDGEPSAGAEFLEEDVRGDLEEGVADEEDHEGDVELVGRRVGFRLHVVLCGGVEDLGVADVGAVEVAEEVDACREGDYDAVLFPDEGALFGGGVDYGWDVLVDV